MKCGDEQTTSAGLIDAAIILQHSIHQISRRNYASSCSRYDYTMIALVHRQAEECSHVLRTVGFQIQIVDTPIDQTQIQDEHLRKNIHEEWCCGHDEFIKWYPYKMTDYLAVVHVDIDFTFQKPAIKHE